VLGIKLQSEAHPRCGSIAFLLPPVKGVDRPTQYNCLRLILEIKLCLRLDVILTHFDEHKPFGRHVRQGVKLRYQDRNIVIKL
jgi:hypothetical protein